MPNIPLKTYLPKRLAVYTLRCPSYNIYKNVINKNEVIVFHIYTGVKSITNVIALCMSKRKFLNNRILNSINSPSHVRYTESNNRAAYADMSELE